MDFFTAPISTTAKAKLAEIRTKNLPYDIKSWMYPINDDAKILENSFMGGYKIYLFETRGTTTDTYTFEMVRVGNKFMIDKYYLTSLGTNGVSEDLKYQGFGL